MISSGMMICSFFLKERNRRGVELRQPLNVDYASEENGNFDDVFAMMDAFCENNADFFDDEKGRKMFSVDVSSVKMMDGDTYRAMSFTIRAGGYGVEADMTDRKTKRIKYRRKADDADIKDFKFLIYVPKDVEEHTVTKGIMIFQTIATYGVKTLTTKRMREFFGSIGLTIEMQSVSVRAFIEKLVEQGNLYKLTLVKNRISPNSADNILISTGREEKSYIRPQLQPEWFSKLLLTFERAKDTTIYEIDGEIFDDIKVEFRLGDRQRTVALRFIEKLSIVEDIPDELYQDGRYNERTLIRYMLESAIAYGDKMVISVENEE